MRNLLVTGGAGFIGSHFIRHALAADPACLVVNLDLLTYAGSEDNLVGLPDAARHSLVQGDIRDRELVEELLRRHAVDTIVHFAAETHVDRSIVAPDAFIETNVVGTYALLEAARKIWLGSGENPGARRFHHISTDEVYGDLRPQDPPCREDAPYAPSSPYAASKAAADHLVRAYGRTYGLPVSLSNCSNNYGPFQHPEKFIPVVVTNALEGLPIPVYGDGRQRRDWLFVEDHVRALWRIVERGRAGETYHVAGTWQGTNLEVAERVCDLIDDLRPPLAGARSRDLVRFVGDRPGHDRRYALDAGKIAGELGWVSPTSFDAGLASTVRWYLEAAEWVERRRESPDFRAWLGLNYARRGGSA
jgi:dTDP-glucose 4,6-dehydratase